ncbi:MAG: multiheme c-type cytochrome [Terriglobia bacterium]
MPKKFIVLAGFIFFILVSLCVITPAATPTPAPLNPPTYNYSEANGCVRCHFTSGVSADHMLDVVGVTIDANNTAFKLSGNGWFASRHAQSNHGSTQNTFCAKCHSPLQSTAQATFNNGFMENTALIADGTVEGVTCAACHPSHTVAVALGRRVAIYKPGGDKNKPEGYQVVLEGQDDLLCLNCHVNRHNEANAAFKRMYDAGVECVDCHMAPYGLTNNGQGTVQKRFHDFKVAQNLPYSCGVDGSVSGFVCHSGFNKESTLAFISYMKEQHSDWWPLKPGTGKRAMRTAAGSLATPADYMALWKQIQNQITTLQTEQKRVDPKEMTP